MTKKEFEEFKKLHEQRKTNLDAVKKEIEGMTPEKAKEAMDAAKTASETAKKELLDELAKHKDKGIAEDILSGGDISKLTDEVKGKIGEDNMKKLTELSKKFDEANVKQLEAEHKHALVECMNKENFDADFKVAYDKEIAPKLKDLIDEKNKNIEILKDRETIMKNAKDGVLDSYNGEQKALLEAFENRAAITKDGKIITNEEAAKAVKEAETKVTDAKAKVDDFDKKIADKKFTYDQIDEINKADKYADLTDKKYFASEKDFDDFKKLLADKKAADDVLTKASEAKDLAAKNEGYAKLLNEPDAMNNAAYIDRQIRTLVDKTVQSDIITAKLALEDTNRAIAKVKKETIESLSDGTKTLIEAGLMKQRKTKLEKGVKQMETINSIQEEWIKAQDTKFKG